MKKFFITSFILLTLLALTTGSVFAGSVLNLVGVSNNGGGPTFTFRVSGEFSPSQLESGFVTVDGGDSFQLFCSQTDATTVVCHVSKKAGGHDVVVSFGGAKFWVGVPEARSEVTKTTQYCYEVYDYLTEEEFNEGYWQWMDRGQTCQDVPAAEGDWLWEYSWGFEDWTWFNFYGQGIDDAPCGSDDECLEHYEENWDNPGAGYYVEVDRDK